MSPILRGIDNGKHDYFHHALVVVSLTMWGIDNDSPARDVFLHVAVSPAMQGIEN